MYVVIMYQQSLSIRQCNVEHEFDCADENSVSFSVFVNIYEFIDISYIFDSYKMGGL